MRVAVASDNGQNVSAHFGRCDRFVIFDLTDGQVTRVEERPNESAHDHHGSPHAHHHGYGVHGHHEAGHHRYILDLLRDCQAVISGGMGPHMQEKLTRAGHQIFLTGEKDAQEAVRRLARGELQ